MNPPALGSGLARTRSGSPLLDAERSHRERPPFRRPSGRAWVPRRAGASSPGAQARRRTRPAASRPNTSDLAPPANWRCAGPLARTLARATFSRRSQSITKSPGRTAGRRRERPGERARPTGRNAKRNLAASQRGGRHLFPTPFARQLNSWRIACGLPVCAFRPPVPLASRAAEA